MKTLIILCGPPCSGKSTWIKNNNLFSSYPPSAVKVISMDEIRSTAEFKQPYKITNHNEKRVVNIFDNILEYALLDKYVEVILLDNTHCKDKYLMKYLDDIFIKNHTTKIIIKFFDCPWWKLHLRNIGRWATTGKWIPMQVLENMITNYNKINRSKYAKYMVHVGHPLQSQEYSPWYSRVGG